MKTHLNCPCGEVVVGVDEDQLVANAQEHLAEVHPGREYPETKFWSCLGDRIDAMTR